MVNVSSEQSDIVQSSQLVSWPKVAVVSAMVAFSLPTFVTGIELYSALSVMDTVLAAIIGCFILTCIGATIGTIGVKTRMSSYLLVRIAFGERGAALVNIAFAISLVGWFGINIDLFSNAVQQLLLSTLDISVPIRPIEVVAGVLMMTTTLYGFKAINILSSALVPIIAAIAFYMLFTTRQTLSFQEFLELPKDIHLSLSDGIAAIVGTIIIGAIILPDITRFSRQTIGGAQTAFWSYQVVQLLVLLVAAMAAAAFTETDVLQLLLKVGLGLLAFIVVIAGSWMLNSLNLYSAVLSVTATFSQWPPKLVTLILGVFGIIAASLNLLDYFITFLSILTAIFVPVAGVIVVDYFYHAHLYSGDTLKTNGLYNPAAIIAWFIGASYAAADILFLLPSVSGIQVIDSLCLTALIYWATQLYFQFTSPSKQEDN